MEYYLLTAANVLGSAVWAYVISSACGIIATLNPSGVHYRQVMDEFNYFACAVGESSSGLCPLPCEPLERPAVLRPCAAGATRSCRAR